MPDARTILIVEDFEPFRAFVCTALEKRPGVQVFQASHGLEAVQKAQELQPDLIFIDIGLPELNGIEAAKRIRTLAPNAHLLFLSQESDSDIVQEAFRLGASAYIHKPFALSHLLPAIDVVLWGGRFLSSNLDSKPPDPHHRHDVLFYCDDSGFLNPSARFISDALRTADATIVLATKSHQEGLVQRLTAENFDIDQAARQGTYIRVDAADILSTVMVNGMPDQALFSTSLSGLIEAVSQRTHVEHPRVAIFGECVGLLCDAGQPAAAISLEKIGNDLAQTHNLEILCAYPLPQNGTLQSICAEHTTVYWP
jgi:DNA-binding NarL/FixJ family response regulator